MLFFSLFGYRTSHRDAGSMFMIAEINGLGVESDFETFRSIIIFPKVSSLNPTNNASTPWEKASGHVSSSKIAHELEPWSTLLLRDKT